MNKLRRFITGCGRNVWAYPPLSDPDRLHRIGLRETVRRAAAALPPGGVVADLGCGWMPYKEWFETDGRTYIPLDVTGYPDHRFRLIRDSKIPLQNASVDVLVCWQVLEHVIDIESFFNETLRILKTGAQAFFTTHGLFRIHDHEDFWRWTPEGLRLLFQKRGFTDFRVTPCDTTYSVTACLINNAWRPRSRGFVRQSIHRALCVCVNGLCEVWDRMSNFAGLSGHRKEATTYMVQVRRAPDVTHAAATEHFTTQIELPPVRVCVAVCTRNRALDLSRLLPSLQALEYPEHLVQFAIVDNASTDNTAQIAAEWCNDQRNAQYLHEPRLGLPFARNLAWKRTDAELVVYLDDDAIPERDWLKRLVEAYSLERSQSSPSHLAIGGRVCLSLPKQALQTRNWLSDEMFGWLSLLDYGPDTFVLDKPLMHLMGANFAVPRDTLEQIGGFAEDMPSYGGDERYVEKRVRAVGGHLVYVGGATVHHQISANKLSPSWFRRRLLTEGKAVAHLKILKASRRSMLTIKAFASGLKAMILGLLAAMRHKLNPSPSNFSHSCRFWFGKGLLGELLGHFLRGGR